MRWPWSEPSIPLSFHDALVAAMRADLRAADARLDAERARSVELLGMYHALRLTGAAVPEPPAPKAEPDPVIQAIIARSGNSRFLRKHYNEYVREQRALDVDEADIAKAILEGESNAENEGVPA